MKKLITLVLLFVVLQSRSQGFEGIVKWSMKMEITDPKMKAQMADAEKKMNDPANQAKMKEMQDKMNDPQFKAMMEANPQMKTQMENMMKMQGGSPSSMIPKGMSMRIKGANTLTKIEGGMMDGMEMLHMADKDQSVRLDRTKKTYTILTSGGGPGGQSNAAPKLTKTTETAKILGYTCTKYLAEYVEAGTTRTETFWATTEIKDMDMKSLTKQRMGQGGRTMLPAGIEGVPLKIESSMKEGNMTMEVTEIKRESQSASDFTIPSDYKEVKGMGF